MTAVNKPAIIVKVTGARGPTGAASGPLGSGSVGADEISNSDGEKAAILAKLGGISGEGVVPSSGASTINGVKTFTSSPVVPSPTTTGQVATKGYVDIVTAGGQVRTLPAANASTITALPASTYSNGSSGVGATITGSSNGAIPAQDGVTLIVGSRLLVLNEAAQARNGLYTVTQVGNGSTPFILTRTSAADSAEELGLATVFVIDGTNLGGATLQFDQRASDIVIGTTALTAHLVEKQDAAFAQIVRSAADAAVVRKLVFRDAVQDEYARSLVTGFKIEQGDAGHDYILNYETLYIGGGPLYRVRLFLHDLTLGIDVAEWAKQAATDWTATYSETVFLTQAAAGTPFADYTGVTATAWIDWDAIDWTKALTTYTTADEAGIRPEHIVTNDMMDDFFDAAKPAKTITVGSGGDFATIESAIDSLYIPGATITRSTFPCSDICTYSNQVLVEVIEAGHTLTVTPDGANGRLIPHYMTLRLRSDTLIDITGSLSDQPPVFEMPQSCRIEGGRLRQDGRGYVTHVDNLNALSKRATVGPAALRHKIRTILKDTRVEAASVSQDSLFGCGISNAQGILLDRVRFKREGTNPTALAVVHTSPNTTDPGFIWLRNCSFNDGAISGSKGLQLLKSHAMTVQHAVIIENTEIGEVANGNTAGGSSGFVRQGRFDGFTYPSSLDPA